VLQYCNTLLRQYHNIYQSATPKVTILAAYFSYSEPSSGQKKEHSSGTFSDCALYEIPYRLRFYIIGHM